MDRLREPVFFSLARWKYNQWMASWIVHLRIAENLLAKFPELDESQFAIGNIAPDSGLPDEKWEKFSPPITGTHFCEDKWFSTCSDLGFFRKYIQGLDLKIDHKRSSFLWGYFCHLVTDNLWNEIRETTYKKYKKEFDADKDFVWEVKNDWYGLDHVYVREFPFSLFWRKFINCVYQADYLAFLPEKMFKFAWTISAIFIGATTTKSMP